jgi:hypothetical protein
VAGLARDESLFDWELAQKNEPLNPIEPFGFVIMFPHTTEVSPLGGYRLLIAFNNGESGEVDLPERLTGTMFSRPKAPALLAMARHDPELETVVWSHGADPAPEYRLDLMREQASKTASFSYPSVGCGS